MSGTVPVYMKHPGMDGLHYKSQKMTGEVTINNSFFFHETP